VAAVTVAGGGLPLPKREKVVDLEKEKKEKETPVRQHGNKMSV